MSKKNLIASLSIIYIFLETNTNSRGNKASDFYNKKLDYKQNQLHYNHTYLEVIGLDSDLMKDENLYLQDFLKDC